MDQLDSHFSCQACGKVAECLPGVNPCKVLRGWLTVKCWDDEGATVEHYNFCSFSCLESWANARVPKVPEVFLKSFKEDKG